jgi:hypothetical protein
VGAKKHDLGFSLVQTCGLLVVINYKPPSTDGLVQNEMSAWSAVAGARSQADNSLTSQISPDSHPLAREELIWHANHEGVLIRRLNNVRLMVDSSAFPPVIWPSIGWS